MESSEKIIFSCLKRLPTTEEELNVRKRQTIKLAGLKEQLPTKTELLKAYHKLRFSNSIPESKELEKLLRRRAVRSLSGVAIVTSLIKPYFCPGECVYCPLDDRMPKSYLPDEPAAMRALTLKFDPYEQMDKRLEALEDNGHPTDKIEFIIKGGTWNSYPLGYQYWFILESFLACNIRSGQRRTNGKKMSLKHNELRHNHHQTPFTENTPLSMLKIELNRQQHINETAEHRIIGLTLETRPDCINYHTIWQMREQGCTRIELGVQSTDDEVLKLTKRGHTTERSREATELLRNYGFKTDFHLMPQLPGATPLRDLAMLKTIFTDPGLKPDMIKIYPCVVVKGSELYDWFILGRYKAYSTRELINILKTFKTFIPYYCRVSRLIRDIPGQYIEDGSTVTNLRQVIEQEMKQEGLACRCLRCREIGHQDPKILAELMRAKPKLFITKYATRGGTEYFLSYEDRQRRVVFAFCRLRLVTKTIIHPNKKLNGYPAYIRELHTYGQLVSLLSDKQLTPAKSEVQHTGFGKQLLLEAEKIAKQHQVNKIAVIAGVGVRDYYRRLGYRLEKTYMVKRLK